MSRSEKSAEAVVCAGQRVVQEGSRPSGARMRGVISERGGNASRAGERKEGMERPKRARRRKPDTAKADLKPTDAPQWRVQNAPSGGRAAALPAGKAYFGLAQTPKVWRELDEAFRHRLRAIQLNQWRRGATIYRELRALGAKPEVARQVAANGRSWWRNSGMLLNSVLTIAWFDRLGLPRLSHDLNFSNRPVRTRMPGGVGGVRPRMAGPYPDCAMRVGRHATRMTDHTAFCVRPGETHVSKPSNRRLH